MTLLKPQIFLTFPFSLLVYKKIPTTARLIGQGGNRKRNMIVRQCCVSYIDRDSNVRDIEGYKYM